MIFHYISITQVMLEEHTRIVSKISDVVKPLMSPHLAKLNAALEPGVCMLTWTSLNINAYVRSVHDTLNEVELLIDRVNDIIKFRIEKIMEEMSKTKLVELPTDTSWTVEEFLNKTQVSCSFFHCRVNSKTS